MGRLRGPVVLRKERFWRQSQSEVMERLDDGRSAEVGICDASAPGRNVAVETDRVIEDKRYDVGLGLEHIIAPGHRDPPTDRGESRERHFEPVRPKPRNDIIIRWGWPVQIGPGHAYVEVFHYARRVIWSRLPVTRSIVRRQEEPAGRRAVEGIVGLWQGMPGFAGHLSSRLSKLPPDAPPARGPQPRVRHDERPGAEGGPRCDPRTYGRAGPCRTTVG